MSVAGVGACQVSLVKPGVPMEIVLNRESKRKTASIVSLRSGERFFGEDAGALVRDRAPVPRARSFHVSLRPADRPTAPSFLPLPNPTRGQLTRYPRDTYTRLLEVLGHNANDSAAVAYQSRFPNVLVPDERGAAAFRGDGDNVFLVEACFHRSDRTHARTMTHWDCVSLPALSDRARTQELVAMLLTHARDQAAEMAGERIVDVIITVPPFFNQFERQALLDAAELAGLIVLELINVDTAVAVHYGITRKFNNTPEYHIFYDMGAASTKVLPAGPFQAQGRIKSAGPSVGPLWARSSTGPPACSRLAHCPSRPAHCLSRSDPSL